MGFEAHHVYHVMLGSFTVADAAGNLYEGMDEDDPWTFKVKEGSNSGPTYTTKSIWGIILVIAAVIGVVLVMVYGAVSRRAALIACMAGCMSGRKEESMYSTKYKPQADEEEAVDD